MNFVYFVCVLIVYTSVVNIQAVEIPDHLKKHAKKLHVMCQKQIGVSEDLIIAAHSGNLPNDRLFQCYMHCLLDKVGLIDEKNIIHLENLLEVLPAEMHPFIQNLIDKCGTKMGADACETAYLTAKCYYEADPSLKNKFSFLID